MSTKIYDAYKVIGKGDPWKTIWAIEDEAKANVTKALEELYWDIMIRVDPEDPEYLEATPYKTKHEWGSRINYAEKVVREKYKKATTQPYRDSYNFDVSLAVSTHKRHLYLRAFCDRVSHIGKSLDFLSSHPDLTDYHFQNQSDRPEGITSREWKRRERTWEAMCNPNTYTLRHVLLQICTVDTFYLLDPGHAMRERFVKNPPVFPTPEGVCALDLTKRQFTDVHSEAGLVTAMKEGKSYKIAKEGEVWRVWVDGELSKTPGKDPKTEFAKLEYATGHVTDYLGLPEHQQRWLERFIKQNEG